MTTTAPCQEARTAAAARDRAPDNGARLQVRHQGFALKTTTSNSNSRFAELLDLRGSTVYTKFRSIDEL